MTALSLPGTPAIAGWIALVLLLSALLFAAAELLERLGRGIAPARATWSGAFAGVLLLALSAPLRGPPTPEAPPSVSAAGVIETPSLGSEPSAAASAWDAVVRVTTQAEWPITRAANAVAGLAAAHAPRDLGRWFVAMWAAASLAVLAAFVAAYRRLVRRIGRGEVRTVAGVPVTIADDVGPLVAGVFAPRIVLPRWLLDRAAGEQALVVAHEQAHVTARDPQLLLCGALGLALLPWNPFSWWFLSRLRLAIELDCDRRLLRGGASAVHYGRLLIDLSTAAPRLPLAAPAFSHHATHLERRIRAMTSRIPLHRRARGLAFTALSAVALLAACESKLPSAAEVDAMDVAALERYAPTLTAAPGGTRYVVDGRPASEAQVRALPSQRIASLEIRRGAGTTSRDNTLFITTRQPGDTAAAAIVASRPDGSVVMRGTIASRTGDWNAADGNFDALDVRITTRPGDSSASLRGDIVTVRTAAHPPAARDTGDAVLGAIIRTTPRVPFIAATGSEAPSPAAPLVYIDGTRRDAQALQRLHPDRIASVEVIKGAAATRLYGPDAIVGVIAVTTKQP